VNNCKKGADNTGMLQSLTRFAQTHFKFFSILAMELQKIIKSSMVECTSVANIMSNLKCGLCFNIALHQNMNTNYSAKQPKSNNGSFTLSRGMILYNILRSVAFLVRIS
jgi:hypothetical protein